jgi:hypothetical protein
VSSHHGFESSHHPRVLSLGCQVLRWQGWARSGIFSLSVIRAVFGEKEGMLGGDRGWTWDIAYFMSFKPLDIWCVDLPLSS